MMARKLKTIAAEINAVLGPLGYKAEVVRGYCDTDVKVGRLRIPKKGRWGNRLIVKRNGETVLDHNAAETYRYNGEVENWLEREKEK